MRWPVEWFPPGPPAILPRRVGALWAPPESSRGENVAQLSDPQDWVEQHGDYLFRIALLRVRDDVVAEDVVQETLLAALQARERFEGQSSERTWLVGILKHKIIDHFRKASREQARPEGNDIEREVNELFDGKGYWKDKSAGPKEWVDPSHAVDRQQFWEAMKHCLAELPPRMARAFSLREIDDMPSEEICTILNITRSNLWVMLHRARTHLRKCLEVRYMGVPART